MLFELEQIMLSKSIKYVCVELRHCTHMPCERIRGKAQFDVWGI